MSTLLRLLKLIAPFRWWIVLAMLLSFAAIGSSVGLMAASAYLISKAAVTADASTLAFAITGVRFFAIARAGFRYAERYFSHMATFRILTRLRVWFYRGIEPLAPAVLQTYRSGDLLARIMADIQTLENFYVRVVTPPLAAALVTALASLFLTRFDVWLGVSLLAFLLLTGVILPLVTLKLGRRPEADYITLRAQLNAALVDGVQGVSDLAAFGQEDAFTRRADVLSHEMSRLQARTAMIRGVSNGLTALFTSLAAVTALAIAIPQVSDGQLAGVLLAVMPLTAIASFEAVEPLTQAFQSLESSRAAAERLFQLIDAPPQVADPQEPSPQPLDASLVVSGLSFRYQPELPPALHNVSFQIPTGSRVALLGPSGAGKSTLANLLLRFWDCDEGRIHLGGRDLRRYRADDARKLIAVVSQRTHLFNTSIRDNLLLANPDAADDDIETACRTACIHDFIRRLPRGYDTLVGDDGARLSGGERQRLAIARALLKEAPILILDEATSHLDPATEQALWTSLDRYMEGRTVLIIAHHLPAYVQLDGVVVLSDGGRVMNQIGVTSGV